MDEVEPESFKPWQVVTGESLFNSAGAEVSRWRDVIRGGIEVQIRRWCEI